MSWVIVTGANGGIGEATVHQLIKNGYSVFAADLAEAAIASFGTYGDATFRYRAVDVTSEESVTALANAVAALDEPITGRGTRRGYRPQPAAAGNQLRHLEAPARGQLRRRVPVPARIRAHHD